jgi:uncharacterized membrane protein
MPSRYKIIALAGIIIIALGVTLSTALKEDDNAIGTVLIAVGGLLLIAGLSLKRRSNEKHK